MNVLILSTGGREHALGWKVRQSPLLNKLYFAPGSAGTEAVGTHAPLDPTDHAAVAAFCHAQDIGLVIPGQDVFYAAGIVDSLTAAGILTFGPTKAAAEIEWSKAYAKEVMQSAGVPTAASKTFSDFDEAQAHLRTQSFPIVIKADGLARGKGVVIAHTMEEASAALRAALVENTFGDAGRTVVIEEYLEGLEFSVHALCAGTDAILFPPSQDHKRAFDGDTGPNTGGMGIVAPLPGVSEAVMHEIRECIVLPTLHELKKRGRLFNGLLYPGIMLTKNGPKVIEFNARFGDPEAQAYMRLLTSDLLSALIKSAQGSLQDVAFRWSGESVACVVVASGGYPGTYEKGRVIQGVEAAERGGAVIFHAGTARNKDGQLVTSGGRVLNVTATGKDLKSAIAAAYAATAKISFDGAYYRTDIGAKAVSAVR